MSKQKIILIDSMEEDNKGREGERGGGVEEWIKEKQAEKKNPEDNMEEG